MVSSPSVPILCYHSIDETQSLISVSPALFADHMAFLHSEGYRVVSIRAFQEMWKTGALASSRTAILTFDDGYENNYALAVPILRRYGFSATFFIATGFVGSRATWMQRDLDEMFATSMDATSNAPIVHERNRALIAQRIPYLLTLSPDKLHQAIQGCLQLSKLRMMNWTQIQELDREGMEIGGHSHRHPFLIELSADALLNDIEVCRAELTAHTGNPVQSFCYPYGAYNDLVKATVAQCGFLHACTTDSGFNSLRNLDRLELKRILLNESFTLPKFRTIFSSRYRWMMTVKPVIKRLLKKLRWTERPLAKFPQTR